MKKAVDKHSDEVLHPFGKREGLALEFKEAANALPKNLFETICAFLNMDGGLIVLGVADNGTVCVPQDALAVQLFEAFIGE